MSYPEQVSAQDLQKRGLIESFATFLIWGSMPLYWKLLSGVPALEVLSWRMVFSAIFLIALCAFVKKINFLPLLKDKRSRLIFIVSGILVTFNWGIYVWATNSNHIVEASLGYYLCPFTTIALGVAFFKERLSTMQKIALVCAVIGVISFIAINGSGITLSVILALIFSLYGAVKKKGAYDALPGMAVESVITGIIGVVLLGAGAIFPWIWAITPPVPAPTAVEPGALLYVLLIGSGVLTAIPLLLYSAAANKVSLTLLGFTQYISPTLMLLVGVLVFHETFTIAHIICMGLIWLGLVGVALEPWWQAQKSKREALATEGL